MTADDLAKWDIARINRSAAARRRLGGAGDDGQAERRQGQRLWPGVFVRTEPRPGHHARRRSRRLPVGEQRLSGRSRCRRRADQQLVRRGLQPHRAGHRQGRSCRPARAGCRPRRAGGSRPSALRPAPGRPARPLAADRERQFLFHAAGHCRLSAPAWLRSASRPRSSLQASRCLRGGFVIQGYTIKYPGRTLNLSTFYEPGAKGRIEQFLVTPGRMS